MSSHFGKDHVRGIYTIATHFREMLSLRAVSAVPYFIKRDNRCTDARRSKPLFFKNVGRDGRCSNAR